MVDRYDSEVAYVDHHIGRIVDEVERRGRSAHTVIAVTADHAEAFYEHGLMGHGRTLYEEMIRVPLVIAGPGIEPAVIDTRTSVLDVAPTMLALIGCGWTTAQEGTPLWSRGMRREPSAPVVVYQYNEHDRGRRFVRRVATLSGDDKLIEDLLTDVHELYDLRRDPGESQNRLSEHPERVATVREANLHARRRIGWVVTQNTRTAASALRARVTQGDEGAAGEAMVRILDAPGTPEATLLVEALARSPDPDSEAILERLVRNHELPVSLLQRSMRALAQRGADSEDRWAMLAQATDAADPARAEAVAVLGTFDSDRARDALRRLAESDPSPVVAAAASVERCREAGRSDVVSATIRRRFPTPASLSELPVETVRRLLACIGSTPTDEDVDFLLEVYATPVAKKKHSVYVILNGLGNARSDRPLPALEKLAKSQWEPVRVAAINAITRLGTPRAVSYVMTLARTNRHLDLDPAAMQSALRGHATRVSPLLHDELPVALETDNAARAELIAALQRAMKAAAGNSRRNAPGQPPLLALHIRRAAGATGRGRLIARVGHARAVDVTVQRFSPDRALPVYLAITHPGVDTIQIKLTGAQGPALELVSAELLWF